VTSTASSQTTTGTLDLAGGSLSFTAFANRYYKVSFFGSLFGDATVNQMDVYDNTAAASILTFENPYSSATFNGTVHASAIVSTWTAGTRSLKLRLIRFNAGTAKSSGGVRLMVEDIGPSGAPN
jgi:pyridoxine 5'-phosphate synthase PdxJ